MKIVQPLYFYTPMDPLVRTQEFKDWCKEEQIPHKHTEMIVVYEGPFRLLWAVVTELQTRNGKKYLTDDGYLARRKWTQRIRKMPPEPFVRGNNRR